MVPASRLVLLTILILVITRMFIGMIPAGIEKGKKKNATMAQVGMIYIDATVISPREDIG